MKTKYLKGITALGLGLLTFSSCLKDNTYRVFDPTSEQSAVADLPISGLTNFAKDAITGAGVNTVTFAVEIASANPLSAATAVTIGVDNTLIATYNAANPAIVYKAVPTTAYSFSATTVTIPAGANFITTKLTIDRTLLDPSVSYMLPVKIVSASGVTISGNYGVHYYHIIGNDFAGAYLWDYRRYQNGTGPGTVPAAGGGTRPAIPSQGEGSVVDGAGSFVGQPGTINPIGPTEFAMLTGYNSSGVSYDVKFTRTVSGTAVTYSGWSVTFNAANIAIWANLASPITNLVPPAFTLPPPTAATTTPIFEINYVSGGSPSTGRYIDDTYHK